MLKSLDIQNYAIIDRVHLKFDPGFNVITGETGAGKSILLGALNLILGVRADTKVLYDSQRRCIVEAVFFIRPELRKSIPNIEGIEVDEELIFRREISGSGKSRAFINDGLVRLTDMRLMAQKLVDIHNQFDTLSLTHPEYQIDVVDAFAQNQRILESYELSYDEYVKTKQELETLKSLQKKSSEDLDYIRFQLEELNRIDLESLSKADLEEELRTLQNAEAIREILAKIAYDLGEGEGSIDERLTELLRSLSRFSEMNKDLNELSELLEGGLEQLREAQYLASSNYQSIDTSQNRLQEVSELIDHVNLLEKKHSANSIEELQSIRNQFAERLDGSSNIDERLKTKEKEYTKILQEILLKAEKLTTSRRKISKDFQNQVTRSLKELAMPNANTKLEITSIKDFGPKGKDNIQITFSANKGVPLMPVSEVASGGELSRLALCVKSLTADRISMPTMIFDEIDTGISGAVALKVGEIMDDISEGRQIICITHSPQVASRSHSHFFVSKSDTASRTITRVDRLDIANRIQEIAKMLSTDPPSDSAVQNAKELLSEQLDY